MKKNKMSYRIKSTIFLIAECLLLLLLITQVKTGYSQYVNLEFFSNPQPNLQDAPTISATRTYSIDSIENLQGLNSDNDNAFRIRGYLLPPQTGYYKFYLLSYSWGSFYLSTDSSEHHKKLAIKDCGYLHWPDSLSQFNNQNTTFYYIDSINLNENNPYYFEIIEPYSPDQLCIIGLKWILPDSEQLQSIISSNLKPAIPKHASSNVDCEIFRNKISCDFNVLKNTDSVPNQKTSLNSLTTTNLSGSLAHYNSRIRGYIVPTVSGNYSFYFACDDIGQFWLSPDTSEVNAQLKSSISSPQTDWNQNVSTQTLVADQKYFFEILQHDSIGNDFIKLGWEVQGDTIPEIIGSYNLISYKDSITTPYKVCLADKRKYMQKNQSVIQNYAVYPWNTLYKKVNWKSTNPTIANVDNNGLISALSVGECQIIIQSVFDTTLTDTMNLYVDKIKWEIFKNRIVCNFDSLKNTLDLPGEIDELESINTPDHATTLDHFASRIRGYLIPPISGNYSFYFACDNVGQFWLSSDTSSANAQLKSNIISIQTDWSQNISSQNLIAGQKYFFEVLHYDSVSTDLIKLGWIIPGDTTPTVVATPYIVSCGDNIPVTKISLLDKKILAYSNWTITPRYYLAPWSASNKSIKWESNNDSLATVNVNGVITTVGVGNCQIIVKSVEDTTLTDTLYLTVTDYYGPFFVKPNATGDGHTWDNAIDLSFLLTMLNRGTLQQQIAIYALAGTYKPTNTVDRNSSFVLSNMRLVGGFAVTSIGIDTTNRDILNYESILSGEIGDQSTTFDNSYHVVKAGNSVIDGITIRDGRASCSSYNQNLNYNSDDNGGGILGGNILLFNCKIINNSAWNGGGGICGGGINIQNCLIDNNHIKQTAMASDGSMFEIIINGYAGGLEGTGGNLNMKNSIFTNNSAQGYGNVFYLNYTNALIENCSFYNNTGTLEDLWACNGSTMHLNNSTVIGRVVSDESTTAYITNSTIIGGGFAAGYNGKVILDNSIWTNYDFSQMQDSSMFEAKFSIVKKKLYGDNKYNVIIDSIPNYSLWLDSINNNGGLTPTAKLKNTPNNYAKTYGNSIYLDSTDQRGVIRKDSVSIGAYQWSSPMPKNQLNYVNWEIFKNKTSYDFNVLKNTDSIPDEVVKLTTINTPDHSTTIDHFASRIRGYIIPPYDGNYSFYFAADDVGQFWLSTDSSSANAYLKSNIQSIQTDWTQNISTQNLIAGQKYFFEILHYDTVSTDIIKLGWIIPGDTAPVVISTPYIVNGGDNVSITKFALLDKNVLAYPNWTITPRYQLTPWNASSDAILWTSTDNSVATISTDGIITTQSAGTCRIIAKVATDTTLTDTLYLTMSDYYGPFFVKPNATGNGHIWDNAIDLQTLLTILNRGTIQQQVTIYASEGTYITTKTIDRNISFILKNMRLVGGYSATSTGNDTANRDIENHATILSGEIGDQGTTIDNSYHVVVTIDTVIIDGVTIRDGRANCRIYGDEINYADNENQGGGIFIKSNKTNLVNCNITNNSAFTSGGGFFAGFFDPYYYWSNNLGNKTLTIQNCIINNNRIEQNIQTTGGEMIYIVIDGYGPAFYFKDGTINLTNCRVYDNNTPNLAPVCRFTTSTANIENCSFFNNSGNSVLGVYGVATLNMNNSTVIGPLFMMFNPSAHIKNSTIIGGAYQISDGIINLTLDNTIWTGMTLGGLQDINSNPQNNFQAKYSIIGNSLVGENTNSIISDSIQNSSYWLDTLNYNGGTTPTMKLKNVPFNYAKTYGNPIYLDSTDQRGIIRKDSISIGAYQWVKPTNISILPKQVTLCLDDSINVNALIQPSFADDSTFIIYSLVDSIAKVSNSKIHAVSAGIVNIIARTIDGGLSDTCHVVVIGKVGEGTISGPANVCSDQNAASYTVSPIPNATSYVWTLPNGNLDTTITNTVYLNINTINQSGILSVKGINSCGDGQTTTYSITVNPSYNLIVNKTICQGDSILVGTHIYKTTGVYNDHLPTSFGCDSAITTHLTVNPTPPIPTITQTGNTLNSSAAIGNQWYNATSGIISSATAQIYNPTANGYYYIIVTVNGCSSDSSNHYYYNNVGIETNENNQTIKVYPNPVSNELIIELEGNKEKVTFEIFNSIGQSIYKGNLIEKATVQTTNFAQGVYLIKLNNGKSFEFKKIVKE